MTRLFSSHRELRRLNQDALRDPRVTVVNADAFIWIDESRETFDFAVVDFPDPSNFSLGKLYTTTFYRMLTRRLGPEATFVVQSTSPLFARQAYWCIVATIEQAGLAVAPYHVYVPSFGEWGFVLAGRTPPRVPTSLPPNLRFLTTQALPDLFDFPLDMARVPVEVNRLHTQALVRYYEREWNALNK
jgi:spermidine synthase